MGKALALLPRMFLGGAVLLAIGIMLTGVFLRYVMVPITDYLDRDPINFFWVEEAGELTLAWLTLIGAAVGVSTGSHFRLDVLTHRLSPGAQRAIHRANHLLIAAFGGVMAWLAFRVAMLNVTLTSAALEISLAWLYVAAVVGGIVMVPYALAAGMRAPVGGAHGPPA